MWAKPSFAKGPRLPTEHFTLHDVLGCTAALFAFVPFFLAPGYFAAHILNLFRFRETRWSERLLLSTTLSVAVTPIVATLIARFTSLRAACAAFVLVTVGAATFALRDALRHRENLRFTREEKIGLSIFCGWAVIGIASAVDLQFGNRLYIPAQAFDQGLRSALTAAAARTGVPPANPFFFPGHPVAMRYYYYWNVLCALPAKLFGLSPRITALTGVIWSGFALAALIPLYLKHFCEETADLGRKSLIGIGLLAVTGLDLIPTIMIFIVRRSILADMEWWDSQQVTSWIDSLLWVPHQIAALVACLIGFLVLWVVARNASIGQRCIAALIAAMAFASASGLSVYVTFAFAIFLVIWTILLLRSRLWGEVLMFAATGFATVALSLPYLHDLVQPGYSGTFAEYYVRALDSVALWAYASIGNDWLRDLFLVLMLPVYYVVELGFFALVGFNQAGSFWRRSTPLVKWEWASVCICSVSLLVGSFLMSTTGNNDLGYRAMLFAQFILLLWAAPFLYRMKTSPAEGRGKLRLLFYVFLWIGVFGTAYQLVELRGYTLLAEDGTYIDDAPWLPDSQELGADLFRLRSGFEELNRKLPPDAVVQYNPDNSAYIPNIYYGWRQSVEGLPVCGTPFGGDPFACMPYQKKIFQAFIGTNAFSLQQANQLCDDLGIDLLIAERADRMWAVKESWVWSGTPVVDNEYMRAVPCGRRRDEIARSFRNQP